MIAHLYLLGKIPDLWIPMAKFPLTLMEISISLLPLKGLARSRRRPICLNDV